MARIKETFDSRAWFMLECDDHNCEQRFDDSQWYAYEDDLLADAKAVQYRRNAIADPKRLPDRWIQACLWTITPHDVADIRPACGKPDTIGNRQRPQ